MGNETFVVLRVNAEKIIARAPTEFRAEMESPVWIELDVRTTLFFDAVTGEGIRK